MSCEERELRKPSCDGNGKGDDDLGDCSSALCGLISNFFVPSGFWFLV